MNNPNAKMSSGPRDGTPDALMSSVFSHIVADLSDVEKIAEIALSAPWEGAYSNRPIEAQPVVDQADVLRKVHDQYPGRTIKQRHLL